MKKWPTLKVLTNPLFTPSYTTHPDRANHSRIEIIHSLGKKRLSLSLKAIKLSNSHLAKKNPKTLSPLFRIAGKQKRRLTFTGLEMTENGAVKKFSFVSMLTAQCKKSP